MPEPETVAIFGGGVAGLTCAHELRERGFSVDVYEPTDGFGGKARSFRYPQSRVEGRPGPPGEHGLRFYPGFYTNLDDTMARIPYGTNPRGVLDNLVTTTEALFARGDEGAIRAFSHWPRRPAELSGLAHLASDLWSNQIGARNLLFLMRQLAGLATSCDARLEQLDRLPWSDYLDVDPEATSPFAAYFGRGWTRTFTALDPQRASTRTLGMTLLRMVAEMCRPGSSVDRVMNGPTSERWIEPWIDHLRALGVRLHPRRAVTALDVRHGRVRGATITDRGGRERTITADHYVCAVPVEVMTRLLTPAMHEASPRLGRLGRLETNLMGGVQFFLDRPVSVIPGHIHCADAPWALTAITQSQFWSEVDLGVCGTEEVRDVLSVCIADWRVPGLRSRRAMDCTVDEIAREVWTQLLGQLPPSERRPLKRARWLGYGVDPRIADPATRARRCEPLFIHTLGCWGDRPTARTEIEGLFLASDYVRNSVDVACMEGANEAARRAVDAVLAASSQTAGPSLVRTRRSPWPLEWLRALDAWRFARGSTLRTRPWASHEAAVHHPSTTPHDRMVE